MEIENPLSRVFSTMETKNLMIRNVIGKYKGVTLFGPMCSGKSTLAKKLQCEIERRYPEISSRITSLGTRLKELAVELYEMDPNKKDRRLLVKLAKALRSVDDCVFIKHVLAKKKSDNIAIPIVDDGRFELEQDAFKEAEFLLVGLLVDDDIRLDRIGKLYPEATGEDVKHTTENIWEDRQRLEKCDLMLRNDSEKDIEENTKKIIEMLFEFGYY
jgi:hypothetical protein